MKLNRLQDREGARLKSKRVGRGIGSGKGKTCGSGGKGQTARTGVAIKGFEGGQMPLHRRLPKRGFNSLQSHTRKFVTVSFSDINNMVNKGKLKANEIIDRNKLVELGLLSSKNKTTSIKLLANGELKHKMQFKLDKYSKAALEAVQAVGGEIIS